MKKTLLRAVAIAAMPILLSACNQGGEAEKTASGAAAPVSVLIVDQQRVLRESLAGQDIARQTQVLREQISGEVEAERQSILQAEQALERSASVLSPAQRNARIRDIEERKRAYPMFEQRKVQVLQLSVARASDQVGAELRPLIEKIIEERGADILLDRQAVMFADSSLDVTTEAIRRLDEKLKQVKVERVDAEKPVEAPPAPSEPAGEGGGAN